MINVNTAHTIYKVGYKDGVNDGRKQMIQEIIDAIGNTDHLIWCQEFARYLNELMEESK